MSPRHPYGQTAVGCGCLCASLAPVVAVSVFDLLGVLQIENGLLIALWLFITLPLALATLAFGFCADRRSSARGTSPVAPSPRGGSHTT